jgi:hypothetical protein
MAGINARDVDFASRLCKWYKWCHFVLELETGRQTPTMIITGTVRLDVLQPISQGLVQHRTGRDVAIRAFVQRETYSFPFVIFEFPSSNNRKYF